MKPLKKRDFIITVFLHALLLLAVYIFQGMIFPFMRIAGLVPLLLPLATVGVALYEGRYVGGITGLFAGVLCDISFNNPVGVFTVFLTLTGLVIGTLADTIVMRGIATYYISCGAVLIVSAFVQAFPLFVFEGVPLQPILGTGIQQTIYSLVLALPIWFCVRALGKRSERYTPSHIQQESKFNFRFASFRRSSK